MNGHTHSITCTVFSPDGKTLVSGDDGGNIKFWHVATGQEIYTLKRLDSMIEKLRFSPDLSALVALTKAGRLHAFETQAFEDAREEDDAQVTSQ